MLPRSKDEFVEQQGFADMPASSRAALYDALMFQPRLISVLFTAGLILQRPEYFLALSAALLWSALLPTLSPFDALYNALIARPRRLPLLGPARAPRRFAQRMAGTSLLVIGVSLGMGWNMAAGVFEGLLAAALLAVVPGRFCLGSSLFILMHRAKAGHAPIGSAL